METIREGPGPIGSAIDLLLRNWWMVALRGVAALLLGIYALAQPSGAVAVLVAWFGIFALVHGVLSFGAAVRSAGRDRGWFWFVIEGAVAVAAAVISFRMPTETLISLVWVVAVWSLVTGVIQLFAAVKLRKVISGEWLLALSGAASVLFGLIAFSRPGAGAFAIVTVLGIYALMFGGMNIALGFRMAKAHRELNQGTVRTRQPA